MRLRGLALAAVGEDELDRIVLQLFDDRDVTDGVVRGERLLVDLGERAGVVLGVGLADRARLHRADQPVAPGAGRLGQQVLDPGLVLQRRVDVAGRAAVGQPNGEVHYRPG